jgi:hypothetical protein
MEIFGASNTYFVGTDVSPYGHLAQPSFAGNAACPVPAKPSSRWQRGHEPIPFSGILMVNFTKWHQTFPTDFQAQEVVALH